MGRRAGSSDALMPNKGIVLGRRSVAHRKQIGVLWAVCKV